MNATAEKRLRAQTETVRRLTAQLRFELLLLHRLERRAGSQDMPARTVPPRSVSDVYRAALLRQAEALAQPQSPTP